MSRFTASYGVVKDNETGLEWEQVGSTEQMNWHDAIKYCENLGDGWRLPTIKELLSIVDYERYSPAIDPIFKCSYSSYWSETTHAEHDFYTWFVNFNDGGSDYDNKYYKICVCRAVRTGGSK